PVSRAQAQGLLSAGVGVGGAVGGRHRDSGQNGRHGSAYVLLHVPVFPIGLRVDGLLTKSATDKTMTAVLADAVYTLPIPVVQPYALAGYGKYDFGKDDAKSGWNAGVGVRVRTSIVAIYAEARRHQRIGRDLLTIGISR
ncbi:MAG: outer membrane beta-barrel protein, partial [Gemmatimonas sp.]